MVNNELCILAQIFLTLKLIYSIGVYIAGFVLRCIAPFNTKLQLGVSGRAETFKILEEKLSPNDKTFWFHCASLGEFEQGLPVFKALRKAYPNHKIVLSFFSPSGYEIRKNTEIADAVIYMPLDTTKNAKRFLDLVNPELTLFVKYEIWPNFLNELKKRPLKALLISAIFRENQSFFKFYGSQTRKALFAFDHIFTQNETSKILLKQINYTSATVSGDTRFDRVLSQLEQDNTIDFIEQFKDNKLCVVVGSSWPEDEKLIVNYINNVANESTKFIIAPHNIKPQQIQDLKQRITKKTILFSEQKGKNPRDFQVYILDTIGLLSKVYSYADIAYIGGAMGHTGLHNTLEAAVFGIPILIGKHYNKFPEAVDMINNEGLVSISNQTELNKTLTHWILNTDSRLKSGAINFDYIKNNKGAVDKILNFLNT